MANATLTVVVVVRPPLSPHSTRNRSPPTASAATRLLLSGDTADGRVMPQRRVALSPTSLRPKTLLTRSDWLRVRIVPSTESCAARFRCRSTTLLLATTGQTREQSQSPSPSTPATKEPRLGSIVMNPGGPGGSGVDLVKVAGAALSAITGGQHDYFQL
ncbi:hypothetical protein DFJ73DRAFT_355330 [Zopfochytrium polystomum]|nr:hypothetical protein DFJ73DRAFT_355330 [Zopfochytrium polystomum]